MVRGSWTAPVLLFSGSPTACHLEARGPGACLQCRDSRDLRESRWEKGQEKPTSAGPSIWTPAPLPNLKAKAAPSLSLRVALFSSSVLPLREDGEVLGDSTGVEDRRALSLLPPQVRPAVASARGAWVPTIGAPVAPCAGRTGGGEGGKGWVGAGRAPGLAGRRLP